MSNRLFFSCSEDRGNFFNSVLEHSGYNSWKKFTKTLDIGSHDLWRYRVGKYCMSKNLFSNLIEFIPTNERGFWLERLSKKDSNWGQVRGGKITSERHPGILADGRKKVIQRNSVPKYNFDINLSLNKGVAEFVGAFIGDGCTGKYWNKNKFVYQTKFAGDALLDLEYYKSILFPITKQNFGFDKLHIYSRDNSIVMNLYSKRLYEFWTQRLKMPSGLKFDKVLIPDEILCDSSLVIPCIRGIFDTDGCVFFDKRKIYKKPYVRIALQMLNPPLINQVSKKLEEFGVQHGVTKKGTTIQINGFISVKDFVDKIGFSNERHVKKICIALNN